MKKKCIIISTIIAILALIIIGAKTIKIERVEVPDNGSQVVKMASEEILMQVLRGEKEFIDNDGKEITINSLNIEDVNLEEGFVVCTNGNKKRNIPLGTMSLKALKEYIKNARDIVTVWEYLENQTISDELLKKIASD